MMSLHGPNAKSGPGLTSSAYRGRPEVAGPRPKRRDWPEADYCVAGRDVWFWRDCVEKVLSSVRTDFLRAADALGVLGRGGTASLERTHSVAFPKTLRGHRQPKSASHSALPLGSSTGIADTLGDRAGVHVAVVDAPAFFWVVTMAAAGESGHAHNSADRRGGKALRIRRRSVQPQEAAATTCFLETKCCRATP